MNTEDLLWEFMPEGLREYFDIERIEKSKELFRITLIEKQHLIGVPPPWQGRTIVSTSLDNVTLNDYPIRGRKGELLLKRRSWKFEGVDKWYRRDIEVKTPGTQLQKEFALFLKGYD